MSIQLSANSYMQMLNQSGLLTVSQRRAVEKHLAECGQLTAAAISDWLVQENLVTRWQSEKLLQARYRGFFLGPYRLLNRIARGGMSSIYSARHSVTNEIHALKVLPPARTAKASYLPRFQREAEMTQRLTHPNIVRVFGVYEENDGQNPVHFMAMELLDGRDLFEIVNQSGPLSVASAIEYIRQAAAGLCYAHRHGLVHRDIKPGNLFLTNDGAIRILDLGLAQDFDSEENLTRDFNDRVLGTADYLAPEQAADSHAVDARADLYSLGCTLFFMLTGRPPYTEGTLVQRLVAHQTKSPPPLSDFRNDVPDSLAALLRHMMARNRNDRIEAAAAVEKRLQAIADELASSTGQAAIADVDATPIESLGSSSAASTSSYRTSHRDVETATASSDDSWPDELWQAIAEASAARSVPLSPTTDEQEIAKHEDLRPDRSSDALRNMPVEIEAICEQDFEAYLHAVEEHCHTDHRWKSEPRAAELVRFIRQLRNQPAGRIRANLTLVPGNEARSLQHAETGNRFRLITLILTVLLAAVALAATQL